MSLYYYWSIVCQRTYQNLPVLSRSLFFNPFRR